MFVREELHRIDRLIAEPHFKVQVRARNPPGPAEIADILALLDLLAFPNSEFVQMGITQGDAFSGIDVDGQAIGAFAAAVHDLSLIHIEMGIRDRPGIPQREQGVGDG